VFILSNLFGSLVNDSLSGTIEWGIHNQLNIGVFLAKIIKQGEGLVGIGAGEADDDGDINLDLLWGINNTLGNCVTLHDTTKNVYKDGLDLGVLWENLEGCADLLSVGTTADIQEVGRLATLKLDDIHGSHSQTSTIYHASNIAIECDIVKSSSDSLILILIDISGRCEFLSLLVHINELLLSE